jgi:hypothetical protein
MNLATSFMTPCRETAGVSAKVSARDISRDIVSRAQRNVRNRANNQAGMARLAQVSIAAIARHVDVDNDTVGVPLDRPQGNARSQGRAAVEVQGFPS